MKEKLQHNVYLPGQWKFMCFYRLEKALKNFCPRRLYLRNKKGWTTAQTEALSHTHTHPLLCVGDLGQIWRGQCNLIKFGNTFARAQEL